MRTGWWERANVSHIYAYTHKFILPSPSPTQWLVNYDMVTASTTELQSCHVLLPGDIKLGQLLYTFLKNAALDFLVIGRTVCIFTECICCLQDFFGGGCHFMANWPDWVRQKSLYINSHFYAETTVWIVLCQGSFNYTTVSWLTYSCSVHVHV